MHVFRNFTPEVCGPAALGGAEYLSVTNSPCAHDAAGRRGFIRDIRESAAEESETITMDAGPTAASDDDVQQLPPQRIPHMVPWSELSTAAAARTACG